MKQCLSHSRIPCPCDFEIVTFFLSNMAMRSIYYKKTAKKVVTLQPFWLKFS